MLLMDTLRDPGRAAVIDAPGLNPFALGAELPALQHVATDRGLRGAAGPPHQVDAGRPAAHRRLRQLHRRHQRVPHAGRHVPTPAVEPQRRDRDGLADRRRCSARAAATRHVARSCCRRSRTGSASTRASRSGDDLREAERPRDGDHDRQAVPARRSRTPNGKGNAIIDAGSLDASAEQASAETQADAEPVEQRGADRRATVGHRPPAASSLGRRSATATHSLLYEVRRARRRHRRARGLVPGVRLRTWRSGAARTTRGALPPRAATSSTSFVETLCGDDTHYKFDGQCRRR